MPYVQRNQDGKIVAIWNESQTDATEFLDRNHPEIELFLAAPSQNADDNTFTIVNDLQMVRVIEDLVDILIAKHIIKLTDLPVAVQNKLLAQRHKRERLFGSVSIIGERDQDILF